MALKERPISSQILLTYKIQEIRVWKPRKTGYGCGTEGSFDVRVIVWLTGNLKTASYTNAKSTHVDYKFHDKVVSKELGI